MPLLIARLFVGCAIVVMPCVRSSQWPIAAHVAIPNLELSLASPSRPHPEVMAEIGSLTRSQEAVVHIHMDKLQVAFSEALGKAKRQIGSVIGRGMSIFDDPALLAAIAKRGNMAHEPRGHGEGFRIEPSFLQLGAEPTDLDQKRSIKVNVFPSAPLDLTVKTRIDELDRKREDMERGFFEQAHAEMQALIDLVQTELEAQIGRHLDKLLGRQGANMAMGMHGFAEVVRNNMTAIPQQANVKVVASDMPYPSVVSLVQDMETRRDISENLEYMKVIKMQVELLKATNSIAKQTLVEAVARVLAQYASLGSHGGA